MFPTYKDQVKTLNFEVTLYISIYLKDPMEML